ncbi:MAG: DUF362 domain-containing protein [bacterium]|nr:DUF362 domain-containing protein [bacterium]
MAHRKISRRKFIKQSSIIGFGSIIIPKFTPLISAIPKALAPSKVVVVTHPEATSGSVINQSVVQMMTDTGIRELTGIAQLGQAWQSLFPGLTASSVIAIKVNCINNLLSTHPQVINTVINGLAQMLNGSFNINNIIIYDRTNSELTAAGYTLNTGSSGVRCFGTNHSGVGYDTSFSIPVGSTTRNLTKIVTQYANYLINAAVLKDHSQGGVTLSLKNHYGSVNNPGTLAHGSPPNGCNPDVADISNSTTIRTKTKLIIIDALFGKHTWGPGGSPNITFNGLIFSTDPVAADCVGRDILNTYKTTPVDANYIHTAASYGLGNDIDINRVNINLVPTEVSRWEAYAE